MPKGLQPPPEHTTWFMAVDADGHVAHDLQGHHGYHMVSGVREFNASRYLTSLTDSSVAAVSLPPH